MENYKVRYSSNKEIEKKEFNYELIACGCFPPLLVDDVKTKRDETKGRGGIPNKIPNKININTPNINSIMDVDIKKIKPFYKK